MLCYLLGEYIHSHNYAPDDLHHTFSILGGEVEAWSQEHYPGYFLTHPPLFHLRQVQPNPTIMSTISTKTHSPTLSQQIDCEQEVLEISPPHGHSPSPLHPASKIYNEVCDFQKGIKHDITLYSVFKDDQP